MQPAGTMYLRNMYGNLPFIGLASRSKNTIFHHDATLRGQGAIGSGTKQKRNLSNIIGQLSILISLLGAIERGTAFVIFLWILEARMAPTTLVENLNKEDRELACILGASIRTAQAKALQISK